MVKTSNEGKGLRSRGGRRGPPREERLSERGDRMAERDRDRSRDQRRDHRIGAELDGAGRTRGERAIQDRIRGGSVHARGRP